VSMALGALLCTGAQRLEATQQPPKMIPKATKPCSPDEAKWWEALRAAAEEAVAAHERREQTLAASKPRRVSEYERMLSKLDADVTVARERYLGLLREGLLKSYRPPIPDSAPIILIRVTPQFTQEAKEKRIKGVSRLSITLRSDGFVSDIEIVKGLGAGLDEQAIEAAKQYLFLPMVKDGVFTSFRSDLGFSFNIS
jgi:TonB family protein